MDPKAVVITSDNVEFALPPREDRRSDAEMEKHYHSLQVRVPTFMVLVVSRYVYIDIHET